ncbi:MAG TPA: GFA family protein, partial [Burkholderiales bacterium]|nr:GFA family protein [Burkholderiales bacterium]
MKHERTTNMEVESSSIASGRTQAKQFQGGCFCGSVRISVSGEPAAMGYCHCESCRVWSASPVNAFTLWKPEAVRITQGAGQVAMYSKTPRSLRKWCTKCGGHLFTEHPAWGLIDVYAGVIPG